MHGNSVSLARLAISMDTCFTLAIDNIKKRLRDFTAADPRASDLTWDKDVDRSTVDRNLFPIPHLILYVLHGLCSFPLGYRGEKTHWIVPFIYRGATCAIACEKFGTRLYISSKDNKIVDKNELLRKIRKAIEYRKIHFGKNCRRSSQER